MSGRRLADQRNGSGDQCEDRKHDEASRHGLHEMVGREGEARLPYAAPVDSHRRIRFAKLPTKGGAVAQLGERLNGIQEVDGSTPFSSTNKIRLFRRFQTWANVRVVRLPYAFVKKCAIDAREL